jgi:hypothetical protein
MDVQAKTLRIDPHMASENIAVDLETNLEMFVMELG